MTDLKTPISRQTNPEEGGGHLDTLMEGDVYERLEECEERYRSFSETSIDAIITSDKNDAILTWNRGAENIFHHGREQIGRPVTTIIPRSFRQRHLNGIKRFLKTGERHIIGKTVEMTALRKDGNEFPIELSLSSWSVRSGILFGAIIRDISERKHIERVREDINRMMRHDLKSPLLGITGLARVILRDKNLDDKHRKAAGLIEDIGKRTLRFIGRTRDLLMMEQGAYDPKPMQLNLIDIFHRVEQELKPTTKKREIPLSITVTDRCHKDSETYLINGDEGLIEVMFSNLIKNAVEASPKGTPVHINIGGRVRQGQRFHFVDIHNSGTVPEEIRGNFFKPYATSGKKGGTGLGTYSALLVAKAHKGDIEFSTSEKQGTHVIVYLPKEVDPST
jgi:PAS domain S-box-containing protein